MRGYRDEDAQEIVTLEDVHALYDSGKALKVQIDGMTYWCPHSQIHYNSEVFDCEGNANGKLVVSLWWAIKEGLA